MDELRTIGRLASAAGVPVSTVRYYERRGLLEPDRRSSARYRLYGVDALRRLRFIRAAQSYGFTLEDIRVLLDVREGSRQPCEEVRGLLERRLREVNEELAGLTRRRDVLEASIQWCRSSESPEHCRVIAELEASALGGGGS